MKHKIILLLCFSIYVIFAAPAAWVKQVKGAAKIQIDGTWHELTKSVSLHAGDVIKTGNNSMILIAYKNGSLSRVYPDSQVTISKLEMKEDKSLFSKLKIQKNGKILSSIRKLGKNNDFSVEAPAIIAGVRGTTLYVEDQDGTSITVCYSGKVIVQDVVQEQGLKTDDVGMMTDFLDEISLGEGDFAVSKQNGAYVKKKKFKHIVKQRKADADNLMKESKELAANLPDDEGLSTYDNNRAELVQ